MADAIDSIAFTLTTAAAGGTFDITIPDFSPAVDLIGFQIHMSNSVDTDGTITDNVDYSVGAGDGTNQIVFHVNCLNGVDTTGDLYPKRIAQRDCVILGWSVVNISNSNSGSVITSQFSFNSFIEDGIRLDIDVASPIAARGVLTLIRGASGSSCFVGDYDDIPNDGLTESVTGVGFEADWITAWCQSNAASIPYQSTWGLFSQGTWINDGSDTQKCVNFSINNIQSNGRVTSHVRSDYVMMQGINSSFQWGCTIDNAVADGFDITATGTSGDTFGYMAVKWGASPEMAVFNTSVPTTATYTETQAGFIANKVTFATITGVVGVTALDTVQSTNNGTLSFTSMSASGTESLNVISRDAQAFSLEKTVFDTKWLIYDYDGSTVESEASSVELTKDGWTVEQSTTPSSAILGYAFAFAALPTDTDVTATSVTLTLSSTASETSTDTDTDVTTTSLVIDSKNAQIVLGASLVNVISIQDGTRNADGVQWSDTGFFEGANFISETGNQTSWRWDLSSIPSDATITSATLLIRNRGGSSGNQPLIRFAAKDVASAGVMSITDNGFTWVADTEITTATVDILFPVLDGGANLGRRKTDDPYIVGDLSPILQELIDSYGATLGNVGITAYQVGGDNGFTGLGDAGTSDGTELTVTWDINTNVTSVPVSFTLNPTGTQTETDTETLASSISMALSPTNPIVETDVDTDVTATSVTLTINVTNAFIGQFTTGNQLLSVSSLSIGNTALDHLLNIQTGSGPGGVVLEIDKIVVKVVDTPVLATVVEEAISVTVVDTTVNTQIVEEDITSTIDAPDTINVETFSGSGSAPISINQFSSIFTDEFD